MGRLLQILGCALMLAAIGLAAGGSRADAEILAPIARAVQAAVQAAGGAIGGASPAPTPTPILTPKPKIEQHGGPLEFNLAGSLSLGESSTTSTLGQTGFFTPTPNPNGTASPGPFPFQQASTTAQQEAELGAGFTADVSRRTATTTTDLRLPFGWSANGESELGTPQFLYSTPKYSLGYGSQQLLALGQLQLGSTLRGFSFIMPQRYGQATFYEGPALGPNQETDKLEGVLVQEVRGRALVEGGLTYGDGPALGQMKMLEFGGATALHNLSLIAEGAWQTRSAGDATPHGIAAQLRLDELGKQGECAATVRGVPDHFVAFTAGEIYSDRYADFSCHPTRLPFFFDANYEKTGDEIFGVTEQRLETISYSPTLGKLGGAAFSFTRQDANSNGESLWTNAGSATLQTQFLGATAMIGGSFQRSLDDGASNDTQSILMSLRRAIGRHLSLGLTGQIQKSSQLAAAASPFPETTATPFGALTPTLGLQKGVAFDISQQWKKTTVQLGETITRTISTTSDAIQRTPLIDITRQISPVISVTTSLGYQTLSDRLNPAADGRTRVFSISLTAPFSYGNASVSGRIDPRLPATISGKVLMAGTNATGSGANSNFATFGNSSGGVGNVLVTLDNKYVQRTDVSGSFQFSFIPPGQHQVTIDNASIPPGFTASNPVQTITVQGGQAATVSFTIGTFGGILGHVYGTDPNGNPIPLSNVQLRVDGGTYAQTDQSGAFGFGGLSAGQHVVTVIPQTIPATADFAPEALVRKVSVNDGRYTTLDFRAQLLGSIAGTIIMAKDMDKQAGLGVYNAYVVAEPGEHAAIDEEDGSFIIDNLEAGDYTISVDPETIPRGLGAAPDSVSVHLAPGEHYSGIQFLVGHNEKKVVFTLLSGGGGAPAPTVPTMRLSETRLPPRGTTTVEISAPADAKDVSATAFGKRITLAFDKEVEKWLGEVEVPLHQVAGQYPVDGSVAGTAVSPNAMLTVDPKLPLVIVQFLSRSNQVGQTATIRARFLVDVHAGDKIAWEDGTQTVLGKPVSGRVFTFEKQLTLLPLHGLLLTPKGAIPIELL
ncbi:MAG TPA: carboxypeptidase-like regulatory domain-containing protein [Verrucomicrobiae bacterium]|nr:carboxypeptidase-like regulatory domain-containing protein [Verrucomicrobiae bacterium]